MNCKQGDIAIIISGKNTGKIVTCIRVADPQEVRVTLSNGHRMRGKKCHAWWNIAEEVDVSAGRAKAKTRFIIDSRLKPLRNEPGLDETLMWKPLTRGENHV